MNTLAEVIADALVDLPYGLVFVASDNGHVIKVVADPIAEYVAQVISDGLMITTVEQLDALPILPGDEGVLIKDWIGDVFEKGDDGRWDRLSNTPWVGEAADIKLPARLLWPLE